ncbi:hypothetical protein SAMN05443247_05231 [Bradyrhizobium erythrophlei]|nr:hypothetical protein SAMN05443247_05231 [Bradyrhizobium erythrophlei]
MSGSMKRTRRRSAKPRPFRRSITRSRGATIDLSFWRVPERLFDEPDELVALGAKPHWPRRAHVSEGGDEWGDHVDRLIKHIHAIDPKGGSFRCPHNISGKVFNCTRVEFEGPGREPINPSG